MRRPLERIRASVDLGERLGANARDDLERARARYEQAVLACRAAGFSWCEIGRVLGVPRQLLHRRFRRRAL